VILSAAYMLTMVQRIFYGQQSRLVAGEPHFDLGFREHVTLWPMALLMLAMGVASPYWIRGIEGGVSGLANSPVAAKWTPETTMKRVVALRVSSAATTPESGVGQ
jgi:NADH:ubiquinone oxidoreductase subunit 4 (subunit M)